MHYKATSLITLLRFPGGSVGKICLQYRRYQQTWVPYLGQEDPLEEAMASHSSILAWRIPWTEEPCGLQSIGFQRVRQDWSYWACTHKHSSKTAWSSITYESHPLCLEGLYPILLLLKLCPIPKGQVDCQFLQETGRISFQRHASTFRDWNSSFAF